ncbi:hypothetical protein WICPIJ_003186, partial [Wickerhamomyces pijperi]
EFFKTRHLNNLKKSKESTSTPASAIEIIEIEEDVICPVCQQDLTQMYLNKRNEHVERCLMISHGGDGDDGIMEIKIQEVTDQKGSSEVGHGSDNTVKEKNTVTDSQISQIILSDDDEEMAQVVDNSEVNPIVLLSDDESAEEGDRDTPLIDNMGDFNEEKLEGEDSHSEEEHDEVDAFERSTKQKEEEITNTILVETKISTEKESLIEEQHVSRRLRKRIPKKQEQQPTEQPADRQELEPKPATKKRKATNIKPATTAAKKKRVCKPKPLPPSFKTIEFPGLEELIMVDGFQFSHPKVSKYFLSHFHADHYIGLNKSFTATIYCSETTASLLENNMNFDPEFIFPMSLGKRYELIRGKLYVELIDANHCPGAVLFLFEYFVEGKLVKRVLHTGDFRFCYDHYERFKDMHIHEIYLDTTYFILSSDSFYVHPIQKNLIRQACDDISSTLNTVDKRSILRFFKKQEESVIIVMGIYSIGKENLFLNLAKHLKVKIYTLKKHHKTLSQYLRSIDNIVVYSELNEIKDHRFILLVPLRHLRDLKPTNLNYKMIKIQPTGWAGRLFYRKETTDPLEKLTVIQNMQNKKAPINWEANVVRVPYSEHSNMKELIILLNKLHYDSIIPTVSVESQDYKHFQDIKKMVITEEEVRQYFEIDQPEMNDFYITSADRR